MAEDREADKKGLNINFPPSDFESRLEISESLEGELEARLGMVEEEIDALKIADTGNISRPVSEMGTGIHHKSCTKCTLAKQKNISFTFLIIYFVKSTKILKQGLSVAQTMPIKPVQTGFK